MKLQEKPTSTKPPVKSEPSSNGRDIKKAGGQTEKRFGFSLGGFNILLTPGLYSEYITHLLLSPLPNAPSYMEGLINVRGNIVPVYNIGILLNEKPKAIQSALLIGRPEIGAAISIETKPQVLSVSYDQEISVPEILPAILENCSNAAYHINTERWLSIDHDKFFHSLAHASQLESILSDDTSTRTIQ